MHLLLKNQEVIVCQILRRLEVGGREERYMIDHCGPVGRTVAWSDTKKKQGRIKLDFCQLDFSKSELGWLDMMMCNCRGWGPGCLSLNSERVGRGMMNMYRYSFI